MNPTPSENWHIYNYNWSVWPLTTNLCKSRGQCRNQHKILCRSGWPYCTFSMPKLASVLVIFGRDLPTKSAEVRGHENKTGGSFCLLGWWKTQAIKWCFAKKHPKIVKIIGNRSRNRSKHLGFLGSTVSAVSQIENHGLLRISEPKDAIVA